MRFICGFLLAVTTVIPVSAQTTISGSWNGVLKIQERTLHFVLNVAGNGENLSATADSPEECRYGMPVDRVVLDGKNLRFTIAKSNVEFTGTFSGDSISGVFKQHKASVPLTLSRVDAGSEARTPVTDAPECVAGTWKGLIAFPWGRLHMVLHVKGTNENLSATADSPDQSAYGERVDKITVTGQELDFAITKYGVDFSGTFSGGSISGTFGQYGVKVPLKLERLDVIVSPEESARESSTLEETARKNDAAAHPYLEEPVTQLIKRIPELKGISPAADQQALAMILQKSGARMDEFFVNMVDLIAHEEIKQERLGTFGVAGGRESIRDNYLVVRRGDSTQIDFDEFRMDEKGERLEQVGQTSGFLITSGFALICVHLSTPLQHDSRFLYLGDQKTRAGDTYVVAFAQLPGRATLKVGLRGPGGSAVHMLTQGVAWVDKQSFQVLRMRTDLLARQPEVGLDEQTTEVDFSEVHLQDVATPLSLPRDVRVYVKFGKSLGRPSEEAFRNVHHYTNYRRYRVSTKMVTPQ
jgi:hypothetical protein